MTSSRVPQGPVNTQQQPGFAPRRYSPPSNSYIGQVSQPILSNGNQEPQNLAVPSAVRDLQRCVAVEIYKEVVTLCSEATEKYKKIGFKLIYKKNISRTDEKQVAKKFSKALSKAKSGLKEECSTKDVGFIYGIASEGKCLEPFNKGALLRKYKDQDKKIASYKGVKKEAFKSLKFNVIQLTKQDEGKGALLISFAEGLNDEVEKSALINRVTANAIDDMQRQKPQLFNSNNLHWWN